MLSKLYLLFRFIVGHDYGFTAEGNEQWYYLVGLAISVMSAWTRNPAIAMPFTILAIIHFITVHLYNMDYTIEENKFAATLYLLSHVIITIIALFIDWKWALSSAIVVIAFTSIAPDCCGDNLFWIHYPNEIIVMLHTLVFALLAIATCQLPVLWWVKAIILIAAIIIHYIIDILVAEYSGIVTENATDVFDMLFLKRS